MFPGSEGIPERGRHQNGRAKASGEGDDLQISEMLLATLRLVGPVVVPHEPLDKGGRDGFPGRRLLQHCPDYGPRGGMSPVTPPSEFSVHAGIVPLELDGAMGGNYRLVPAPAAHPAIDDPSATLPSGCRRPAKQRAKLVSRPQQKISYICITVAE
jgi:hypothetical protein